MKVTVECSRCGAEFSTHDSDGAINLSFEYQKKRHVEGRHTAHTIKGERPQHNGQLFSKAMGGLDIGPVTWITVW